MRRNPFAHLTPAAWQQKARPQTAEHPQANQVSKKAITEEEANVDRGDKYVPLDMTDTSRMFKAHAQIETAILLKVYHSPIYVP